MEINENKDFHGKKEECCKEERRSDKKCRENEKLCDKLKFRAEGPYPKVKVKCENFEYAQILLKDYAGTGSELTAILQYIYGDSVLGDRYPDVACILEKIAIVEMSHLHMLAEVIYDLGVKPKYRTLTDDCCNNYWCGDFVNDDECICKILKENLAGEKAAIAQYKRHIEKICDKDIQELLGRIIADEEVHVKILTKLLKCYCEGCD